MIEDFKMWIERSNELARQAVEVYQPEVEQLIRNQMTDEHQIQRTLDYLLDFCFDAQMLLLFKKLCRYYWEINPRATADYINFYREMWDDGGK
ncbi:MAG: hypothetical protein HUU01_11570 [Saprospiraceae bacterium]|nr:hypothetical protein [Saprospiraceae bacterium]